MYKPHYTSPTTNASPISTSTVKQLINHRSQHSTPYTMLRHLLSLIALLLVALNLEAAINYTAPDGAVYEVDTLQRTATLTDITACTGTLVIPETVQYENVDYTVNAMNKVEGTNASRIIIQARITSIPAECFFQLTGINYIEFPTSLTVIGNFAFQGAKVDTLILPDNIDKIPYWCFKNSHLKKVHLPKNLKHIGSSAFENAICDGPKGLVLPESIETIENYAFRKSNIQKAFLPNIKRIENQAFDSCAIKIVRLGENFEYLGQEVFFNNADPEGPIMVVDAKNIPNLWRFGNLQCYISRGPIYVRPELFDSYKKFTNFGPTTDWGWCNIIALPDSIETNGLKYKLDQDNYTAYLVDNSDCSLTEITIPEKIHQYIRPYKLTGIYNGTEETQVVRKYTGPFGTCTVIPDVGTDEQAFTMTPANTTIQSVTIEAKLDELPDNILAGCTGLTQVSLSDSIKSIGRNAFAYCENLKSVNIPANATSIGYGAFQGCKSLEEVTFPVGVTEIPDYCFYHYDKNYTNHYRNFALKKVVMQGPVTRIGHWAFTGCPKLKESISPRA